VSQPARVLVTGASGYVATRLIPQLLGRGYRVRCLVRDPQRLHNRPWARNVEIVAGDITNPASLPAAVQDVQIAYYLIHSMSAGKNYDEQDRQGARNFGAAANAAGVEQIIYLGGLGESGKLSKHMQSRHETGAILRESGVPVTEFRASVIIGAGSISFEMIRWLTEWMPVLPAPTPTRVPGQPIATRDLLQYLLAAIGHSASMGQIVEIGGSDQLSYPDLLLGYAHERTLRRWAFRVPFFPPDPAALIADLLTPVPFSIARPLMGELVMESVITRPGARDLFPEIVPMNYSEAVQLAFTRSTSEAWTPHLIARHPLTGARVSTLGEGFFITFQQEQMPIEAGKAFEQAQSAAGKGWQVEGTDSRLWVRWKWQGNLPGELWREVAIKPLAENQSQIATCLMFAPRGLAGMLYWKFFNREI
jgi:uncharacterized protein YbjT (DUF2867 family)